MIAANPDPYGGGTLALYDPLRDNNRGYAWDVGGDNSGDNCQFTGGAYHVSTSQAYQCRASPDFSNFAFEVQMTIIKGDGGGIIFRWPFDSAYFFYVDENGGYNLLACSFPNSVGTCHPLVNSTSSAINQGLRQTNIIAVVALGNTITLYVNHQQIASVTDNTYNHGHIGLVASAYATGGHPTEVVYSNARVWKL